MSKRRVIAIELDIREKGQGALSYLAEPDLIFHEIIKQPVFTITHYGSDYFSSPGDFKEITNNDGTIMIYGKIGKTVSHVIKETIYSVESGKFKDIEIPLEEDKMSAVYTNFYFRKLENQLLVEEKNGISKEVILKFFNHALEKYMGGKFSVKTLYDKDLNEILRNDEVKVVKVKIERPNPINPENIKLIKDIFEETDANEISMHFRGRQNHSIHISEDSIIQSAINLALNGYGNLILDYRNNEDKIERFNSRDDVCKFDLDSAPDNIDGTANWILENPTYFQYPLSI